MNKIMVGVAVVFIGAALAGGYFMLGQQDDKADDSTIPQSTDSNIDNETAGVDSQSSQDEETVRPDDENAPPPPPSS